MTNPWAQKNRPHWEVDPVYQKFNNHLFKELLTFHQTAEICGFNKFVFKTNSYNILSIMEDHWLEHVYKWNKIDIFTTPPSGKIKGFLAIIFFFIVLPYDKLDDVGKYFTNFEVNMINIAYFYNTEKDSIPFADIHERFNVNTPRDDVLNNKYQRASWWITYMVYEKKNGLKPIIDSPPARYNQ